VSPIPLLGAELWMTGDLSLALSAAMMPALGDTAFHHMLHSRLM
jgi:hypothetical protein